MLKRREFLRYLSTLGIAVSFPTFLNASVQKNHKTLVLIELKGGNDGLNTLIPYNNPLYYDLRETLAIKKDKILKIDKDVGFHPSLGGFEKLFEQNQLACLQGVGYPNPNRSHFRSIEIWESASKSDEYLEDGWITDALKGNSNLLDGLVIGKNSLGPMFGNGIKTLTMDSPDKFLKSTKSFKTQINNSKIKNSALSYLLEIEQDIENSKKIFSKNLISTKKFKRDGFTKSGFSKAMYQVARVIVSDMNIPVIKLSLGSFDTHSNQLGKHANLLKQLSENLYQFQKVLTQYDKWDDVLVMTYSEFGRRVKQNASKGCDHGKASSHFMLGGQVQGGLYGRYPSLSDLDNGDLKYNIDFRSIYSTVLEDWWNLTPTNRLKEFSKIKNLL